MMDIEKRSIANYNITITALMEAAGAKISEEVISFLGDIKEPKVVLFCGKGNNGGDGLAAARHLSANGISNDVFIIGGKTSLKGDAAANLKILENTQPDSITFLSHSEELDLSSYDLLVDAILGIGSSGALREPIDSIVRQFDSFKGKVISVDMPTGVSSDDGSRGENAVDADLTLTMGMAKLGQLFSPGRELCGEVKIAQIGFPALMLKDEKIDTFSVESDDVKKMLPDITPDLYKQRAGKLLAIGGSKGMTGAIVLSSRAALSTGCGLVKTAVPASLNEIFEIKLTEEMTLPLDDEEKGYFTTESNASLLDEYDWADALVIGPGISKNLETEKFVVKVAESTRIPMVIDADALSVFKERNSLVAHLGTSAVLTPHHGEFSNTFGYPIEMVRKDPVSVAREVAVKYGVNLVLKGAPTVTADADGRVYINPTGNPGMATAGSGDVLTGIIGSLIAQGMEANEAALCGVYMHGLAGDKAAIEMGERSMKAVDIIAAFPQMFRELI